MTDLLLERFWEHVKVESNGCWIWDQYINWLGDLR
jgi:hypothetical protein